MSARNYESDLEGLFRDIERINGQIERECRLVYTRENLTFTNQCYRTIEGDIYVKVLGLFLQRVLSTEPVYEKKLIGRMRADIFFDNGSQKVVIEVKSHGQFDSRGLENRFAKLTREMRDSKHLYVAFRERDDYVVMTDALLSPLEVETFYFSTYNRERTITHPDALRRLVETISSTL